MPRRLKRLRQPRQAPTPPRIEGTVEVQGVASVEDYVQGLSWSPDGTLLAACSISGPIQVISGTGDVVQSWPGHSLGTTDISWSQDGTWLASVGQDPWVHCMRVDQPELVWRYRHEATWGEVLAWSPRRSELAIGAGNTVTWLDADGSVVRIESGHPSTISDLTWAPNGRSLAVAHFGGVTVWSTKSWTAGEARKWGSAPQQTAWSPDGRFLATGNQDGTVHFWVVDRGHDLMMRGYEGKVHHLAWSGNSQYLATASGSTVVVWQCDGPNGPARTAPTVLAAHQRSITALAFAPHEDMLASGSREGHLCLWHMDRPEAPLLGLLLPDDLIDMEISESIEISMVRWSPDGESLAVGLADGLIVLLRVR